MITVKVELLIGISAVLAIVGLVNGAPTEIGSATINNNNNTVYAIDNLIPTIDTTKECVNKTGWPSHHIDSSFHYNDGCSIICVVKGQDYTHAIRENQQCFDEQHICHHGSCFLRSQIPADSNKVYAHIRIHSAEVRDADPWPMQGNSDAFAVVELLDGPNTGIICHTKTIQDNNSPKWNHKCTSNPMNMSSMLKFSVYDSDKPVEQPDKLGSATVSLEDIADSQPHILSLHGSPGARSRSSYIKVSIEIQKIPK